jgi:hypothetical protein
MVTDFRRNLQKDRSDESASSRIEDPDRKKELESKALSLYFCLHYYVGTV